jgi:hypothetical protein
VLGRTALALHIVLHSVQHSFMGHVEEDLRRLVAAMPSDEWPAVVQVAVRLGVADLLGEGLRHDDAGVAVAESLGLPDLPPGSPLELVGAPRGVASLTRFWAAPTWTAKAQWLRWMLLPSPAKIRYRSHLPQAGTAALMSGYVRWWHELIPAVAPGLRQARARHKQTRTRSPHRRR